MRGAGEREGFLSRWARRKAEAARERADVRERPAEEAAGAARVPAAIGDPEMTATAAPVEGGAADGDREPEDPKAELERLGLPDPESLGPQADFRIFFAEGVPGWLRRRAMRRLFRVNPIIRTVDMMDDYAEDFTDAATVTALLKGAGEAARRLQRRLAGDGREADGAGAASAGEEARRADPPAEDARVGERDVARAERGDADTAANHVEKS